MNLIDIKQPVHKVKSETTITKYFVPVINKLPKKFGKALCILCFFVLTISFLAQLYISNTYAVKSSEMVLLMNKQNELEREVSKLQLAVSEVSSLTNIEQNAHKLGFVEMQNPVSVVITASTVAVATLE